MDGGDRPRLLINHAGATDAKTELEKKQKRHSTVNNQSRKGLSDISNTMGSDGNGNGRPSQTDGDKENIKLMPSPRFKDHVAQLVTENNALLKAVAERNEMIRLTNIELQKRSIQCQKLELQLQKANQQNWELARANSQMLGELNLGKDRLKQLQHELGCARSTIQLKYLEIEEREKSKKKESHQNASTKEGGTDHDEAAKGACHTTIEKKICNTNKRKLKAQSLGTTSLTQSVQSEEQVDGRRRSLRRRSVHSTPESQQPVESLHDVKDIEIGVQSITELSYYETVELDSSGSQGHTDQVKKEEADLSGLPHFSNEEHTKEGGIDHDEAAKGACHTTIEKKICNTNKRKLKAQSLVTTSLTQSVQLEEKVDGRRRSLRRLVHSTPESQQPVESLHDVKDIEIGVQSITELSHNEIVELDSSSSQGHTDQVKKEDEDLSGLLHFSNEEHGRSSVGRPLRRAAKKVASYKEMSRKFKMRREE
ncbi:SHUGOSHIN 2-like [Zingiber officinale]|uniref:Shugoshin C-terminal domain-containing protein n=1 Tax=Zingiber officinale TaxID=94328 RepID=A0A8J5GR52_ZINOF|nr:SHUGOSHIN 2-like [Zingiber officinale]KAG6512315.1 hypothetical protein ZIOFF_030415 [Zingiber officinale]